VKPKSPSFGILNSLRNAASHIGLSDETAGWSWRQQLEPPFLELLLRGVDAVVIVVEW